MPRLHALIALATATICSVSPAAEWTQFLGPDRNGSSTETGLIDKFPESGPKEAWRVKGGIGMSGLAVSRGRVLTMVQSEGKQWVVAHDAKTGKQLWRADVAPAYKNEMGDGPRATPAIVGDTVFTFSGEGILTALRFADGTVSWSQNTVKNLGGEVADYGMASSPLVVGGVVVVTPGAPGATVAAYDIKTGKLAWKSGDDPAGYSSPTLLDLAGRKQVVVFTGGSALGLDPKTGGELWRYPYETNYNCNIAAPITVDGKLFLSSGENHGSVLLEVVAAGKDRFELNEVWASQGPESVLRNEWQTSILLDGRLYGFDNVGGAGPITHFTCVDAETGDQVWQEARFGKGNHIAADGKLWMTTMEGELIIVRATSDGYQELDRAKVLDTTRQAPALADGILYLRDGREIVAIDVRGAKVD